MLLRAYAYADVIRHYVAAADLLPVRHATLLMPAL